MTNVDNSRIYVGEGLATAGSWLNSQAAEASDELRKLRGLLAPLADAWRRSQAATYYQGLQQEWDVAADGLFGPDGVLGQIAQVMHVNWSNYVDAETTNMATWHSSANP